MKLAATFSPGSSSQPSQISDFNSIICDVFRTEEYEYRYYLGIFKDEISAETLDRKSSGGKKPAHIFYRENNEISGLLD